jgi:succinoglycan biosynthesis transport protein ExoP
MAATGNHAQTFNIRDYLQLILKRKWFLVMPTIIAPLVAVLATFFMPYKYQSTTSILIKEASVLPSSVARELNGNQATYRRQTQSEIQNMYESQIKSTTYISSLIAKLDIPVTAEMKKVVAEQAAGISESDLGELAENQLVASLRKQIDVRVSGSNIIEITITAATPIMAKKMTQTLAEIFLEESLAQELAGIQGNISFTEEQLAVYRDKLYKAQNDLRQFRQSVIETSVDEDTSTVTYNLNSIFSAVEALDMEISNAEDQLNNLRINLAAYKVDLNAVSLPSGITRLKQNLMSTIPNLAELLGRYSWRDAKVINLNQETKAISDSLQTAIADYVNSAFPKLADYARKDLTDFLMLDINVEFMRNKSAAMSKSIGRLKSRLTKNPAIAVTVDRLQSEVDRYTELYNLFVQHSQYAAIDQSAKRIEAESKYMIVQPAEMPLAPVSPSRIKMLVLGVILGLMIGIGIILLLVILDESFKKVEEIEAELNLPVLATIPLLSTPYRIKKKERGLIYVGTVISVLLIVAIIIMKVKNG